jgi:hypothetical protein
MLTQLIRQLKKEIETLQKLRQQIGYYATIDQQVVDLSKIDFAINSLIEGVKVLEASEMHQEEYNENYGEGEQEDKNPYVKLFRFGKGSDNPYIKIFGGKRGSTTRGRSGISSET